MLPQMLPTAAQAVMNGGVAGRPDCSLRTCNFSMKPEWHRDSWWCPWQRPSTFRPRPRRCWCAILCWSDHVSPCLALPISWIISLTPSPGPRRQPRRTCQSKAIGLPRQRFHSSLPRQIGAVSESAVAQRNRAREMAVAVSFLPQSPALLRLLQNPCANNYTPAWILPFIIFEIF